MDAIAFGRDPAPALAGSRLFAGMTPEDVDAVRRLMVLAEFRRGSAILSSRQPGIALVLLVEGAARLDWFAGGAQQLTVAVLGPGSVAGGRMLVGETRATWVLRALDRCVVLAIDARRWPAMAHAYPDLAMNLVRTVGELSTRCAELSVELAYSSVIQRTAHRLLDLAERFGHPTMTGGVIINRIVTHAELAGMVGASRQTVSMAMSELARNGYVGTRGRKVVLNDVAGLQRLIGNGWQLDGVGAGHATGDASAAGDGHRGSVTRVRRPIGGPGR